MKKKTRRIIFYVSVAFFLVISFGVVVFAFGYKYDFVQNKFLKTGSFEFKTNTSAEIYINDNLAGKTSFLGNSFSRSQLLPRVYNIRVQNENYQPWQKLVRIEGGFVTSFPKIVLLPKEFKEETVASSSIAHISIRQFDPENNRVLIGNKQRIESIDLESGEKKQSDRLLFVPQKPIFFSPDGNKNVWINNNEIWVEWSKNSNYQPFKKLGDKELVARFSQPVLDVQWYKDSEHLIASIGLSGRDRIFKFIEIDNRGGINIFDISTASSPFYYDKNEDVIYKIDGNKIIRILLK